MRMAHAVQDPLSETSLADPPVQLLDPAGNMGTDPRLPLEHLPADWPAAEAEVAFHAVSAQVTEAARALATRILDVVPYDQRAAVL